MSIETNISTDPRNVCPISGQECDFFVRLNDELTRTIEIDPEILGTMSQVDVATVLYSPERHTAAVVGARKIALKECVTLNTDCGLPSEQKSQHHHF